MSMPSAISPPPEAGLLWVLSRPKPEHTQEYHEWYNTEHGPLRLQLDDLFLNGYRYRCVEDDNPLFLATYDLSSLDGFQDSRYINMRKNRSSRESSLISEKLDYLNRRIYRVISIRGSVEGPAPVIMAVSLVVRPESFSEVDRWYEKEHIQDLSRIPGWRRTRRFQLVDASDQDDQHIELFAVHDFDKENGLDGSEHIAAKSRPWRNRVMEECVVRRENKRFEFFHEFHAADYRSP